MAERFLGKKEVLGSIPSPGSMKGFKKILVFSAHPDDLDFGCSGTVAKMTEEGKEVAYCIITNGERGVHKVNKARAGMIQMREREQKEAAKVVGVRKVIFLRERDGDLENTKDVRRKIVKAIREVKPDIIYSFDPANLSFDNFYRFHRDHRMAAEAVFDAMYPAAGSNAFFPELARAGFPPHQIQEAWFFGTAKPGIFIDISETTDKKIEALRRYKGQIPDMAEMEKRIRSRAREEGKRGKMKYAESFRSLTF